jgi:hypothetical protein
MRLIGMLDLSLIRKLNVSNARDMCQRTHVFGGSLMAILQRFSNAPETNPKRRDSDWIYRSRFGYSSGPMISKHRREYLSEKPNSGSRPGTPRISSYYVSAPSRAEIVSFQISAHYFTHPIKEDVKKKIFSPPLWEMRKW